MVAEQEVAPQGGFAGGPSEEIPYIENEEAVQEESAAAVFGDQSLVADQPWNYDDDDDEAEGDEPEDDSPWYANIENEDVREYVENRGYKSVEDALAAGMEARQFVGSQSNEVGQLRAEIESLRAQVSQPAPTDPAADERAELVRNAPQLRADIYRMVDEGEMDMDQAGGRLDALNEMVMQDRLEKLEAKFDQKFNEVAAPSQQIQQQYELDQAAMDIRAQLGPMYDQYEDQAMKYVEAQVARNPNIRASGALIKEAFGQVALEQSAKNARRESARVTGEGSSSGAARQQPQDPAKALRRAIKGRGRNVSGGFA